MDRPDLPSRLLIRAMARVARGAPAAGDLAAFRARANRPPPPRAWRRRGLEGAHDLRVPGAAGPIAARLYVPPSADGLVLYMHGGGFVFCGLDSHDGICASLARASRASVLSIDYRLAPEHPFPAAPEDCHAAYRWLVAHAEGFGRGNPAIAVAGDSAGGTLAAVVAMMARDRGDPMPCLQVLYYPATVGDQTVPSRRAYGEGFLLTEETMRWFKRQYLGGRMSEPSPYYMPAQAQDLRGLPPALIVTAEFDPLRDEGRIYADRLEAAGVSVRYGCVPGTLHGFLNFEALIPKARRTLRQTGAAIRNALDRARLDRIAPG